MNDQFGNPIDSDPEAPTLLQKISAGLGIALIALGVFLAAFLFLQIVGAIRHPEQLSGSLDTWEKTLRGEARSAELAPDFEIAILPQGSVTLTAMADAPTTATTAMGATITPPPIATPVSLPFRFWRTLAVLLVFFLTGMLVRIAFGLMAAGGNLLSVAQPYRKLYQWVMRETMKGRRQGVDGQTRDFDFDDKE